MQKILDTILRFNKILFRNPKDAIHVIGVANSAAKQIENPISDCRYFRKVDCFAICNESYELKFQIFPNVPASISLLEAAAICSLLKVVDAKRVFEFGTYKGVSTTQIALNLPDGGMVFTLDLPEDHQVYRDYCALTGEKRIELVVPASVNEKITYLRGDSAEFDPALYSNSMDFVFVDGYHSYEYVKNDTEKGWEMLRPGGIIAWHDCEPGRPEVVRYLKEFQPTPILINNTALAYSTKPC